MPVPMQLTKVRRGLCPAFEKGRLFYMKKSVWISLIAAVAAIAAAAIAIAALVRRKTSAIAQELDFEPDDEYYDPEEDEDEDLCGSCEGCPDPEEADVATSAQEEPMEIPVMDAEGAPEEEEEEKE